MLWYFSNIQISFSLGIKLFRWKLEMCHFQSLLGKKNCVFAKPFNKCSQHFNLSWVMFNKVCDSTATPPVGWGEFVTCWVVTITLSNKEGWGEALDQQSGAICSGNKSDTAKMAFWDWSLSSVKQILHWLGGEGHHTQNAIRPLFSQVQWKWKGQ